ncbi:outer membrane lipoprotein carrier protein LolA [Pajaroellobacter abortibovis]|uniref:outer membrane lipoprotein carrier protein LolA n=1 Tax=Pajaroellobacter abortibovis TaxID=1882918 RepID=UPI001FE7D240|nr:outer membrane lipoprotein carrier protein LolA [Pajaroellobacter abortibovis]
MSSFSSRFTQKSTTKVYPKTKVASGEVFFMKPGNMRWIYHKPNRREILSNGKKLFIYEADDKKITEYPPLDPSYTMVLSFLTGEGKLANSMRFEFQEGESHRFPGGIILIGTPQKSTAAYQQIFFFIDRKTSQIRRVAIHDVQGNTNSFDFENPTINPPLNPKHFELPATATHPSNSKQQKPLPNNPKSKKSHMSPHRHALSNLGGDIKRGCQAHFSPCRSAP